ncbi:MAG TPA: hypothetical protein V6C97_29795 [Oculatellaceae cyanobacterium]
MYVCIYVCVCMYVCMYVCVCMCMCMHVCACIYECMCACIYVCVRVHGVSACVCTYIRMCMSCLRVCVCVCTCCEQRDHTSNARGWRLLNNTLPISRTLVAGCRRGARWHWHCRM